MTTTTSTSSAPRTDAPSRRWAVVVVTAAVVFVVDQLTKWWALESLDHGPVDLFWTLRLNLTSNTGSAFGLGSRYAPFIALSAVAVVLVLLRASRAMAGTFAELAVGLVAGGAFGNLADRVFRAGDGILGGAVVDFLDLQWWPVFNVADAAICVGAVALALATLRE